MKPRIGGQLAGVTGGQVPGTPDSHGDVLSCESQELSADRSALRWALCQDWERGDTSQGGLGQILLKAMRGPKKTRRGLGLGSQARRMMQSSGAAVGPGLLCAVVDMDLGSSPRSGENTARSK